MIQTPFTFMEVRSQKSISNSKDEAIFSYAEAVEKGLNFDNERLKLMFDELEDKDPEHFAVRQYKKYKLAAGVVCFKRLLNQSIGKSLKTYNLQSRKERKQ